MNKPVTNIEASADLNSIVGAVANLHHLLDSACLALGELDYGTGASRNHDLDRAAALVDVSRTMIEVIESDLDAAYPKLVRNAPAAVPVKAEKTVPVMDFTGWTILDFELAVEGWIRMEHAISGITNQPRAMPDHGRDYHPGAGYFRNFQEDWAAFQLDRIMKYLRAVRFEDADHEQRRLWLILRYASEFPDELSDLLEYVNAERGAVK
ncbi:MAG: hypothetical protein PGN22_05075 [Agrobacterium cavarae]